MILCFEMLHRYRDIMTHAKICDSGSLRVVFKPVHHSIIAVYPNCPDCIKNHHHQSPCWQYHSLLQYIESFFSTPLSWYPQILANTQPQQPVFIGSNFIIGIINKNIHFRLSFDNLLVLYLNVWAVIYAIFPATLNESCLSQAGKVWQLFVCLNVCWLPQLSTTEAGVVQINMHPMVSSCHIRLL